jgi:hypothetical protein
MGEAQEPHQPMASMFYLVLKVPLLSSPECGILSHVAEATRGEGDAAMENSTGTVPTKPNFVRVNQTDPDEPLVLGYLGLRRAVGIIGLTLPFVLAIGRILLQGFGLEGSISCYYYTDMGNVFVGSLCAIGVFLLSCRGYDRRDAIAGRLACAFALGVALFPTGSCSASGSQSAAISRVHWSSAALLFLTLAYFCLALFTQTAGNPTPQKRQRNTVYRVCGYAILACILLIAVVNFVPTVSSLVQSLHPVFWLESGAVISFGVAWLTKGEMILKDQAA